MAVDDVIPLRAEVIYLWVYFIYGIFNDTFNNSDLSDWEKPVSGPRFEPIITRMQKYSLDRNIWCTHYNNDV
jgi:hypothetical protein